MIEGFRAVADSSFVEAQVYDIREWRSRNQRARVERLPGAILVIDPDDVMRGLMVKLLKAEGHRVLEASTIEEGRRLASYEPVDLLVSTGASSRSPSHDPVEAMMAEHPAMKHVRIADAAETPRPSPSDRWRTMVLQKPFSSVTLVESVRAALGDAS